MPALVAQSQFPADLQESAKAFLGILVMAAVKVTLFDSMDGTGEHYAKWNKPGSERQIPYDLTYKWNLINKTNNKQNINRGIEIKSKPTVTMGEEGEG